MAKNVFIDQLKNLPSYNQVLSEIEKRKSPISLHGLSDENIGHISYGLNQHINRPVLILTEDDLRAKKLFEDLKFWGQDNVELFPTREIVFYDIDAYSHDISNQRLRVLNRLNNNENITVVASVESLLNKTLDKKLFKEYSFNISFGETIDFKKIAGDLNIMGYDRVDMVEGKGQYSIRGGIIDLFPINSHDPYRIELFDDEIDSIRSFNLKNQRSIENKDHISVNPVKEIILTDDIKKNLIKDMEDDLNKTISKLRKSNENTIIDKLEDKFSYQIEKLKSGLSIDNIDLYIPYMVSGVSTILDYFNDQSLIVIDEPRRIEDRVDNLKDDFVGRYTDLYNMGEVLPKHEDVYHSYDEIINKINNKISITATTLLKNNPRFKPKSIINFMTKSMQSFHNKLELLVEELNNYRYRGYKVIILSGTEDKGKRLEENLNEKGIGCKYISDVDTEIKSSEIYITEGSISKGFEYPKVKLAIISDKEVFGTSKKRRTLKKRKDAKKIESFTDLKVGDYVVHEGHGIGKYVGIEQLKVQDKKKDYMKIQYSGEDKLYVPVDQMNLIQKYIGADTVKPKVNKLGSSEWRKTKTKVKKSIEDMADELLKLYAKRETVKGYAFSKDQPWQKQFEDSFPYEETDDQLRCIEEIKEDMEKGRPMDRLLCGDVGYGKTEVALRAAFKAVMDGKQVAFLVPTTILAQQHYNTLVERFSDFPIKIEMLSRFRTPGRQKKIINDVKGGNLDIVVGTHRILSKDIKFYDLGLLVVDEEQRFGVKHKESLKKIKESVDVLTLTATPIPRTLHMSMVGIRDMSVIEEPPEERYPVQTYVVEYNEQLIRDAIVKEYNRNGQVYIVYNRVKGIQTIASKIKKLVPEIKVAVGHGQMGERQLENTMMDFLDGEYDVLVCTTIIETGLDIPNVNTMIILDADKMGLSQLYQLRGRVGRSNRLAYSYFMYEKDKVLSEVAEKRLKAIKEFTEFGSGFKIAMRDLEIRGAGNLLGQQQHGHMASIGYDLYVKFLESAIKKLKGQEKEETVETTIEINVDGYIPNKYIPNEEQKVEIYKKISAIETKEEYRDVLEEIIDRFGDVNKAVNNLLRISYIKSLSQRANIVSISQKDRFVTFEFSSDKDIKPELINFLATNYNRRVSFDVAGKPKIMYRLRETSQEGILLETEEVVEKISSFHGGQTNI
ncbi:transcription-repair coupling factor [Dethiothermospora halolimnae]|uniref:transcription-repair coupling factor n=1 Tax=Dethiothermospora halolimnae TaxID=3114390 RepID=UPI003CCB822C